MPGAIEVTLDQLAPSLQSMGERIQKLNWNRLFNAIALMLEGEAKRRFDEQRAPDGTPWAPLKTPRNRPRDKRARGGSGQQVLRDSGRLQASLTAAGGPDHIKQIEDQKLTWGSNVEYAGVHQGGAKVPAKQRDKSQKPWVFAGPDGRLIFTRHIAEHEIPARPFLGITEELSQEVEELIADELQQRLGETTG